MIVRPETLKGFKLFLAVEVAVGKTAGSGKSSPADGAQVQENAPWGEERIAAELSVKLGILVSPQTVRAYWRHDRDPRGCKRTSPATLADVCR